MNAKNIKSILVSYLQATYSEVRIYQEKSIGSSICDVMAVTDRLMGFEIKSDLDNYSRLQEQVKAYNLFFDENYIVVGEKHSESAAGKIPSSWGIICIKETDVEIIRKAIINKSVSRRRQLSILWKLELKNLLIQNNMPVYAQKEKGYIADRLAAIVDGELLGKQIANQLMHRDYSVYDAKDYSIYSNNREEDEFPTEEIVDVLSENDLSEFTLDKWIEIYKKATLVKEHKNKLFEKTVEKRVMHEIPYTDIEVSLGVPWVSKDIINDFIYHILDRTPTVNDNRFFKPCYVEYEEITGSWSIPSKRALGYNNTNAEVKYGIKQYNALYIIEATLNLREIRLHDKNNKYDEKNTVAAIEKQKLIKDEFKKWIWQDEDRIWEVEEAYNKMFSNLEKPSFDGSKLSFPNMSEKFTLYPYQKDAVQKIISGNNTLLAFDVGAGKTYIMIAAAMKMRQEGISRKNMFVVPNHIVGQWEKIFSELYPTSKILAIEPKMFKPEMRTKVLTQIRDGDYDGIIIAYSCFLMIPLSVDSILDNMNVQLKRIETTLNSMRTHQGYIYGWDTPLNQEKKRIVKLTQDFINCMNTDNTEVSFDELEINTLFLDEAHNYKNLPIRTSMRNLRGINTKGSNKCLDLLHKVRCVQQANDGRGVVFATGTPLCNSIADAYAMQMYLQYEQLQERKLDVFDNWVKTFALPEQFCEIDVNASQYRFVYRFAKFFNLPELSKLFSQIAIFYANTNIEGLPEFSGYKDEVIEKYPELAGYMKNLCERSELIRSGIIDKKHDNMLKVSTDGRKAALDLKLVGEEQPYNQYSKIFRCVENVYNLYKESSDETQLIFCDYSTPKGEDFSVYAELRDKLVEKGIPKKEIAFIHNYKTESRKVELFKKFNNGEIRILLGSTFKLGVGANVQVKLKAIHHLDVPWRPADMVQREGRILRKGNTNTDVLIYRYVSEGSFDSYSWQLLETKQRFISQFLTDSLYQRTASDLEDSVLSYAEVKALALSEPLMKQLAEKENEAQNLRVLIAKEKDVRNDMEKEFNSLDGAIISTENRLAKVKELVKVLRNTTNEKFLNAYHQIENILTYDVVIKKTAFEENVTILGFKIVLPEVVNEKKPYIFLECKKEQFLVEMGESTIGNAKRVINLLKRFNRVQTEVEEKLGSSRKRKDELEELLKTENNVYVEKLRLCEEEIEKIREKMDIFEEFE